MLFFQNVLIKAKEIFLIKPVFENGDGKRIDVLPTLTKHDNNRIHFSTKVTPKQESSRKNERFAFEILVGERTKIQLKYKIDVLVRTADLRKTFSKTDTTNWSYNIYKITEFVNDTLPSYRLDSLPERYKEALLKKTELSMKGNDSVMKKLNVT